LGKSGSGKSTLESIINDTGYANKIISTTTRKRRSYEVDSKDYYFISEEVFKIYLKQGQYAEWSTYTTVDGEAYYGINKNDIHLDKGNAICVINVSGYEQLINNLGEDKVVGIYITRDDRKRVISALERDLSDFENTLDEVYRRFKADKIDFEGIENKVKYIIENKDLHDTVQQIMDIIEEETK
jgi:guanylate kinase